MSDSAFINFTGVKHFIGRTYEEYKLQENNTFFPYTVIEKDGQPTISVEIKNQEVHFAPEEISAMVLSKLKERAEEYLKQTVTKAVITVPAHFNDAQRQATKDAGRIAGLEVLRIINEPTSAALAYELNNKYSDTSECNVVIYDFGGGTFDVSVITITKNIVQVKATNGEAYLGGDDIDKALTEHLITEFKNKHNVNLENNERCIRKLQQQCEKAKKNLSSNENINVEIDLRYRSQDLTVTITRQQIEEMSNDLFKRTLLCVEKTLQEADLTKDEIQEVVLVGGSTRISRVRQLVSEYFNNIDLNASLNPDEAVAIGAARQAAILNGHKSERITSVALKDVCSLSLGLESKGGRMSVIIPRNTNIPVKKSKLYQTSKNNQTFVILPIYEGERTVVEGNRKLGQFRLSGLTPAPRGHVMFEVIFEIDSNGILNVTAQELESENRSHLTVSSAKGRLSEEEIEKMIEDAAKCKAQDAKQQIVIEARNELHNCCSYILRILNEIEMDNEEKRVIESICDDIKQWMKLNKNMTAAAYTYKKRELQKVFSAFISCSK